MKIHDKVLGCQVACVAIKGEESVISVPCNQDGWTGRQDSRNEKLKRKEE